MVYKVSSCDVIDKTNSHGHVSPIHYSSCYSILYLSLLINANIAQNIAVYAELLFVIINYTYILTMYVRM